MKFGDIVKQLRIEKRMSQDDVASLFKKSRVSIANYEANRQCPNYNEAMILLDKLTNYEKPKCKECDRDLD